MVIWLLSFLIFLLLGLCLYLIIFQVGDKEHRKNVRDLKSTIKREVKILESISSIEDRIESDVYMHDDLKNMLLARKTELKNELDEIRFIIRLILYDMKFS